MNTSKKRSKKIVTTSRVKVSTFIVVVVILTLAVSVEVGLQIRNNRKKVDESSTILAEQIAEQIRSNSDREEALEDSHKESSLVRAQSAAYIMDSNDLYLTSVVKLKTVADVVNVDEINIINTDGVIYAGTNPENYGLSMETANRLKYFKPMLSDKTMSLVGNSEFIPALNKTMLYACVWSSDGSRIYQIGVEPTRLVDDKEVTSVQAIIEDIPYRTAVTVFIADAESGDIMGSTDSFYDVMNLVDLDLYRSDIPEEESIKTKTVINGEACYAIVYNTGVYLICVAQSIFNANQDIAYSTLIMVLFLIVAILLLLYFINSSVDKVREQETIYLREVEKERASRLEATVNDIMKNALDQNVTSEGIKIVAREVAKELGAKSCMLYAEDPQMGLEAINVQWSMMPDGTDEFLQVEDTQMVKDSWTWSISTDGNAVVYDISEIKDLSMETYLTCCKIGAEKLAIISFINQYRAIGFLSLADPNIERMEDIALVMKQMSKFVISLLKIKAAFDKLTYLGYNDNLTHALNRRALDDRADRIEAGSVVAIIFCDITGLKRMNDEKGHDAGDKLIVDAYGILEDEFGANAVYRVGGDEFICLIEDITKEQLEEIVTSLDNRIEDSYVEMSVGSVWTGDYAGDFAYLERAADANMYKKKVEYYRLHPELKREVFERRQSQELRSMIENLAKAYPLVGTINLADGTFRIIKGDPEVVETAKDYTHFDEYVKNIRKIMFSKDSIERLEATAYIADIAEALSKQDAYVYRYQLAKGGWRQMTYQVSERDVDGTPIRVIFFANSVSEALGERLKSEITTKSEFEILDGLCFDYSIIAVVDRDANKVMAYRYNNFPESVAEAIDKMSFEQLVAWYTENYVVESERARFRMLTNLDYIDSHLRDNNNFSFTFKAAESFRNTKGGSYARFYFYKPEPEVNRYVFATRNLSFELSEAE